MSVYRDKLDYVRDRDNLEYRDTEDYVRDIHNLDYVRDREITGETEIPKIMLETEIT